MSIGYEPGDDWAEHLNGGDESNPMAGLESEESSAEGVVIRIQPNAGLEESFEAESVQTPVRARILWPALGFPAVIAPRANASGTPMRTGDATRCVTVLLLSDRKNLSKAEAAASLRYVRWSDRGRRHLPPEKSGSFAEVELEIRNDSVRPMAMPNGKDDFGEFIAFGGDADGARTVSVTLANRLRTFYRSQGLAHLHEIRVSEQASARLADGLYHLFWNNQKPGENAPSDELALLLEKFVPPRREKLQDLWNRFRTYLLDEYEYEYRPLHPIVGTSVKGRRAEILHPLRVARSQGRTLRVGHLTDTHVCVRADLYGHNLAQKKSTAVYNNWNVSFAKGYQGARNDSDIILITGDLIDYGRGHWGRQSTQSLNKDELYHVDRNWFLFYDLIASGDAYQVPVYTILGNHDWRINPYPPFAIVGAPGPRLFIHDHSRYSKAEQSKILETAHGPGFDPKLSYEPKAENRILDLLKTAGTLLKALGSLLIQTRSMDVPGSPAETTVESVRGTYSRSIRSSTTRLRSPAGIAF